MRIARDIEKTLATIVYEIQNRSNNIGIYSEKIHQFFILFKTFGSIFSILPKYGLNTPGSITLPSDC